MIVIILLNIFYTIQYSQYFLIQGLLNIKFIQFIKKI